MIDFQAAQKKRLEEPTSEISVKPLCAMVSLDIGLFSIDTSVVVDT